jgi:hypothetical protein
MSYIYGIRGKCKETPLTAAIRYSRTAALQRCCAAAAAAAAAECYSGSVICIAYLWLHPVIRCLRIARPCASTMTSSL